MASETLPDRLKKIEELESIRGLAALLVLFFHIPKWNPVLDIGIVNNGYLMVDLFFVLSGFVIFNAYLDKISTRKDLIRFQFLRFGRLYPVHIIFLLVFILIDLAKYIAKVRLGVTGFGSVPFGENNFDAFIKNVFLIQSVLPNQPLTYNHPSWSISVEFYTYLVFGLIVLFFRKSTILLFSLLAAISLAILITESAFGNESILRCFTGFFVGCLTAEVTKKKKLILPGYISFIVTILIVAFLQLKSTKNLDFLIYFLTAGLIVSLVLSQKSLLNKILNFKALTWLGGVSYSVYMSHAVILWAVQQFCYIILKKPKIILANGEGILRLSGVDTLIACSMTVASVLVVSAFVFNFVEKPLREKSRRFAFGKLS